MLELRNPKVAVPVVLFAGIIWSFGPLVVRNLEDPNLIPWQYVFGRGLTIFILFLGSISCFVVNQMQVYCSSYTLEDNLVSIFIKNDYIK